MHVLTCEPQLRAPWLGVPEERETILRHNPTQPVAAGGRHHFIASMPKIFWLAWIGALQTLEEAVRQNSHGSTSHTSYKLPACSEKSQAVPIEKHSNCYFLCVWPKAQMYMHDTHRWCYIRSVSGAISRMVLHVNCVWGLLCQHYSAFLPRVSSRDLCCGLLLTHFSLLCVYV